MNSSFRNIRFDDESSQKQVASTVKQEECSQSCIHLRSIPLALCHGGHCEDILNPHSVLSLRTQYISMVLTSTPPASPGAEAQQRPPRYPGEDTTPTSRKEIWGWYAYGIAAEVFAVCGVGTLTYSSIYSVCERAQF
jgi:hypothetical protein